MKHVLNQIKELLRDLSVEPLVKFTQQEGADVIIATYKIGGDNWMTIGVD